MSALWPGLVYLLCLGASILCAALLIRAWWHSRSSLLLWTAVSFGFLALSNLALVADMVLFPDLYLWPLRFLPALIGIAVLLYGFVWESSR